MVTTRRTVRLSGADVWRTRAQTRRSRLVAGAVVAVLTPALAVGAAGSGHPAAGTPWMGTSDSGTPLTLAQIRTIIGAGTGAAATLNGTGVGVALVDTGVAPVAGLPAAQVVNGPDLSFESQASSLRYLDTYGHGTHMAGIIVASDSASGTVGLAPKAKLTSIKVGTSQGAVDVTQVIAAIDWVVAHRKDDTANPIRVLNLSYGTGGHTTYSNDPLQFAVEQAWKAGIVVVAAAGNDSKDKVTDPASDQYVIDVGSADSAGTPAASDDTLSTFTNVDKGRALDVLAPGQSVESLRDPGSDIDTSFPSARVGTTLFRGTGTSQATAVTSAAVALLLQAHPTLTPDQVKKLLSSTGTPLAQGYPEINVSAAVAAATPTGTQSYTGSRGTGQFEGSRGSSHVVNNGKVLLGEIAPWGLLSSWFWAPRSAAKTAWSGGSWMGFPVAGSGWTGKSWASKTWAATGWLGVPWGMTSWTDPDWSGHYWSGGSWNGGAWTGHYWSSEAWTADVWTTARWS